MTLIEQKADIIKYLFSTKRLVNIPIDDGKDKEK